MPAAIYSAEKLQKDYVVHQQRVKTIRRYQTPSKAQKTVLPEEPTITKSAAADGDHMHEAQTPAEPAALKDMGVADF